MTTSDNWMDGTFLDPKDPMTYLASDVFSMVRQFHRTMGQELDQPYIQNSPLERLRLKLISEEFDEVCASETPDNMLKELADLLIVTVGYAATYGWDLEEAVRRVHASNMSKLDDDGKPVLNDEGKVMKGVNYYEPDMSDLVRLPNERL